MQSNIAINFTILLAAALVGGMIAHRLRQPVILGYLIVGAVLGPYGLGLIRDSSVVEAAAAIGVALLMFTLGLEVSVGQLRRVGRVGLWGGLAQILVTAALGLLAGELVFGWSFREAAIFGLVISLSSTMVCLKVLMERGELDTVHGRIMIAMLILQDISVVAMIVVTPVLGQSEQGLPLVLGIAAGKVLLFIGLAVAAGLWVLPWLMGRVGGIRSRELFLLIVLVLCMGAALGTQILGLSAVFGAFLVGLVLRETRFAHQALAEVTPLRDIFAALFFMSLGMLLDLRFIMEHWLTVITAVSLIIAIKVATVFGIVRSFGYNGRIAVLTGAGLFQIGEFGFILAQGGVGAGIVSAETFSLIVGSAVITMLLTPLSASLVSRLQGEGAILVGREEEEEVLRAAGEPVEAVARVVIAGFGRVGRSLAQGLRDTGIPYSVIEIDPEIVFTLQCAGTACIYGDASNIHVLSRVALTKAGVLVVTYPDPAAVVTTVRSALFINPKLRIVARVHRSREADLLKKLGVVELVNPEFEASVEFLRRVLSAEGWTEADIERITSWVKQDRKMEKASSENE